MNLLGGLAEFAVKRWQFTVLLFLMFGSCVSIAKYINLLETRDDITGLHRTQKAIYQLLFVISASSLMCMSCTLFTEYISSRNQHSTMFYQITAATVLLFA